MEPYNRFLSSCTKTGGYKKSEDGEFPATGGPPYILLTPESCDSYRKTNLRLMIQQITLYGFINDEMNNKLLMGLGELVIGLRAFWSVV